MSRPTFSWATLPVSEESKVRIDDRLYSLLYQQGQNIHYLPDEQVNFDNLSRNTMRKGTHSCVECRQRKVRCVSQPHARKCDGCSTRDLRCTDQELRRSRSPDSGERKSTRDRVRELEGMLNQVLSQQSRINQGFGSRELDSDVAEPFGILPAVERRIPATEGRGAKTKKRSKMNILESTSSDAHVTKTQNFSDEPLRKLFENVDVGEKCDCNLQGSVRGTQAGLPVADKSAHRSLQALLLQVPNSRELMSILGAGQTALGLWSGAFPDKLRATGNGALERLRDHIYTCLHSDSMADAAKVILCLALHIQQLPTDIETLKVSLLAPTYDLQETYMTAAENLLASDEGLAGSLDGLECLLIQSEFYINKGNLRKVWLIIRRAVNLAQLLGLHRKIDADISPKQAVRWKAIWLELWQRDRGFSLILGLPYATLDSQVPQLTSDNDDSDLQKTKWFLRDLGIVMGHIVDRDQDPSGKTYSITLKIEEELEKCQRLLCLHSGGISRPVLTRHQTPSAACLWLR